jgi:two-component system, chemotaxis family, chemotaxis protein CheY
MGWRLQSFGETMMLARKSDLIVIAAQHLPTRSLISDVLRGGGFFRNRHARDGAELLRVTEEHAPQIVIAASRLPGLSGLEFTRLVRGGFGAVPRELPIIAMTDTPTKSFVDAAQQSGADEMLVCPFTANAVLLRVEAVLERPRTFIDSAKYIGPSRRRRTIEDYAGPMRRFVDPVEGMPGAAQWESEPHRALVRICLQKISATVRDLTPGDRQKLRGVYGAVQETEAVAAQACDAMLQTAARSLGRYIVAIGAEGVLDIETVETHIDAMQTLGSLTGVQHKARQKLVDGLERVVDKKLGRKRVVSIRVGDAKKSIGSGKAALG